MTRNIKKILLAALPAIAIILELLPYGAVLKFAPSPTTTKIETYSYFSPMLIGYANFAPFAIALFSCLILALTIVLLISGEKKIINMIRPAALASVIISVVQMFLGIDYITVVGCIIAAILAANCILLFLCKPAAAFENPENG